MKKGMKMRCKLCNAIMERYDWKRNDPSGREESLCSSCLQDVWRYDPDSVIGTFPLEEALDMEEGIFVEYKRREIES